LKKNIPKFLNKKLVKERIGGFPNEKIEKIFEKLVIERAAREIAERVRKGEDKYKLLGEYGKQLKKEGIKAGKELEKSLASFL